MTDNEEENGEQIEQQAAANTVDLPPCMLVYIRLFSLFFSTRFVCVPHLYRLTDICLLAYIFSLKGFT
jgi:hypothetical protein